MRGAEHDVDAFGIAREDRGKGIDHVLDPLVRREQPEREDDRRCPRRRADPCSPLARAAGRDAVGNDVDLAGVDAVDLLEELAPSALITTTRSERRVISSMTRALRAGRLTEDRVSVRHDRHAQLAQQREQDEPALPPKMPYSCWTRDDVDAVDVQKVGRAPVGRDVPLADLEGHALRVVERCPGSVSARSTGCTFRARS